MVVIHFILKQFPRVKFRGGDWANSCSCLGMQMLECAPFGKMHGMYKADLLVPPDYVNDKRTDTLNGLRITLVPLFFDFQVDRDRLERSLSQGILQDDQFQFF